MLIPEYVQVIACDGEAPHSHFSGGISAELIKLQGDWASDAFEKYLGSDTSMAQEAYLSRTPCLILGFLGFKSSSNFGDSCWFLFSFELPM